MNIQPHESLSKLEAGTRQLHLAIDLFFTDADPLGVHTLAGAAHGILSGLLAYTSGYSGSRALPSPAVRTNRELVEIRIAEAKNFLKHADRDPGEVLHFHPNWTDFLLFDAIRMHVELAQTITKQNGWFLLWLSAKYPGVLILDDVVGAKDLLVELRRTFPSLGTPSVQKRTFRTAMNQGAASDL